MKIMKGRYKSLFQVNVVLKIPFSIFLIFMFRTNLSISYILFPCGLMNEQMNRLIDWLLSIDWLIDWSIDLIAIL